MRTSTAAMFTPTVRAVSGTGWLGMKHARFMEAVIEQ